MDLRDTPRRPRSEPICEPGSRRTCPDELRGHRGGAARFDGPRDARVEPRALRGAATPGLTWPEEYGGGGAPYSHQAIFLEEMARAEAPPHIERDRARDGRADDHRARHRGAEGALPRADPLRGGDLVPGLLGARRRLRPRRRAHARSRSTDDHFVVNGQKVWSSFAHIADCCILLARSDPDVDAARGPDAT